MEEVSMRRGASIERPTAKSTTTWSGDEVAMAVVSC